MCAALVSSWTDDHPRVVKRFAEGFDAHTDLVVAREGKGRSQGEGESEEGESE